MRLHFGRISLVIALVTGISAHVALADPGNTTPPIDPDYASAVNLANVGKYAEALAILGNVVARDPDNADAWNYIGYSNRKLGQNAESLAAYQKALAINPDHLGANEYLGELYVQTGDIGKAKQQLATLNRLCLLGCREFDHLKAAIDGNKDSSLGRKNY